MSPRRSRLERLWYPGADSGTADRALSGALRPLSAVFGLGARLRRAAVTPTRVEGVRIVSVGNLHVGGMGKTPVVIHLAERAVKNGHRVAILSRGYGRSDTAVHAFDAAQLLPAETVGDEPRLIAQRVPQAKVYVGADRVHLAQRARDEGATLCLLDDGFQHRRLHRDVDIVVIDEAVGFGNGQLLPAGPLREPPSALSRASFVWLRRSDRPAPGDWRDALPAERVLFARHRTRAEALEGQRVIVLTGLARPSSFLDALAAAHAQVHAVHAFPDHHVFTDGELKLAQRDAAAAKARVVTTEKDAQRLPPGFEAVVVKLDVEIESGEALAAAAVAPLERPQRS